MKRRPPRGLSPEDRALWEKVAQSARPMDRPKRPDPGDASLSRHPKKTAVPAASSLAPFQIGQNAPGNANPVAAFERAAPAPLRMDAKTFKRMKQGKSKPEARIDLHGMTAAQAHHALAAFILKAAASDFRLVLVITGKGSAARDSDPIPAQRGVLRRQLPQWLSLAPLASHVLQVTPAHRRHGGDGAFYVYLRRSR